MRKRPGLAGSTRFRRLFRSIGFSASLGNIGPEIGLPCRARLASEALRTFHATAKKGRHRSVRQDRSSNRTKLDVWGTLLPVVIAHGSWCRENEGRGISSTLNRGSYWLISRVLPAWRRHLSRWSLRCYGSNSEAKPSRRSICRRTFWGRLPCGLGRTAEDTAVPGGTGVAMKPGDSNVSGWNASPTI